MLQTVRDKIERLRCELVHAFGGRFECLVLVGSHARGDAHGDSDIDLWLFLDEVSLEDLKRVGQLVGELGSRPEVNVQCTSFGEVGSGAFREGFSPLQIHFDGQVLHGTVRLERPARSDVVREAAAIACFVMMSCRHYIARRESAESLLKGKLMNWVLKPLMWALRYEVFARTGRYPKRLEELAQTAGTEAARELVEVFRQLLTAEFRGNCIEVVDKAECVARRVMHDSK